MGKKRINISCLKNENLRVFISRSLDWREQMGDLENGKRSKNSGILEEKKKGKYHDWEKQESV